MEKTQWKWNPIKQDGPCLFSSFLAHTFLKEFETHIETLNACWLFVNGPHSIWLAPNLTRNVAKFHLLHPSPGSSTGLMCLKLPRCRARSQPAHDRCGCWEIRELGCKKKTLIPQPSPPNSYSTGYRRGAHGLAWKVHPLVLISEPHVDRVTNSSQPNTIQLVLQTFLCNMAPVVQLQCQILASRAPAPSRAAARSTEAPVMPWQRWIGSIRRPKVTTSWRQDLNIFYGFNLVSSKKSLIQSSK